MVCRHAEMSLVSCDELLPGVPVERRKRHGPDLGGCIVRQEGHGWHEFPVMLSCHMFGSTMSQGFVGSREAAWQIPYRTQARPQGSIWSSPRVWWTGMRSGNHDGAWDTTTNIYLDQASSHVTKSLIRLLGEGLPTSGSMSSTVRALLKWSCIDSL